MSPLAFPDARGAPGAEPVGWGDDLSVATLVAAYRAGYFPWPDDAGTVWWWSPDPRAVVAPRGLRVSRSLRRTLRSGRFRATSDTAFDAVVAACADRPGEGTWITPAMRGAYLALHRAGHAHSVEVWDRADTLVGGLYGVATGGVFCGESMFHRRSDASKVAMVATMRVLAAGDYAVLDAQLPTPHLTSMGAVTMARDRYLDLLDAVGDATHPWDVTAARGDLPPG